MEEKLLLWIFHATNAQKQGIIHHTYARTEIEARQRASAWMALRVNEGFGNIEVKHCPGGFGPGTSTWWPGSINTSEVSHATNNE